MFSAAHQPPKTRILVIADIRIMKPYSPRKKSAKGMDEYSTKKPATSSDSPSGRSKGERLVSASVEMKKMTAIGNAIYTDSAGRVFAGNLVHAYFAADGSLASIDAEGDVKVVTTAEREATGDAATYDAGTELATVTGNVKIIDGGSQMLGGRAEVDLKTGNSRMLSAGSGGRVSGVLQTN